MTVNAKYGAIARAAWQPQKPEFVQQLEARQPRRNLPLHHIEYDYARLKRKSMNRSHSCEVPKQSDFTSRDEPSSNSSSKCLPFTHVQWTMKDFQKKYELIKHKGWQTRLDEDTFK